MHHLSLAGEALLVDSSGRERHDRRVYQPRPPEGAVLAARLNRAAALESIHLCAAELAVAPVQPE
jgi:hypothetical protein